MAPASCLVAPRGTPWHLVAWRQARYYCLLPGSLEAGALTIAYHGIAEKDIPSCWMESSSSGGLWQYCGLAGGLYPEAASCQWNVKKRIIDMHNRCYRPMGEVALEANTNPSLHEKNGRTASSSSKYHGVDSSSVGLRKRTVRFKNN